LCPNFLSVGFKWWWRRLFLLNSRCSSSGSSSFVLSSKPSVGSGKVRIIIGVCPEGGREGGKDGVWGWQAKLSKEGAKGGESLQPGTAGGGGEEECATNPDTKREWRGGWRRDGNVRRRTPPSADVASSS